MIHLFVCFFAFSELEPPTNSVQAEFLHNLGLEPFLSAPLDSACMLNISTWTSENLEPLETKDLPFSFLQRLWLLSPDARSTCCRGSNSVLNNANHSAETANGLEGEDQRTINPLDLVTAVYMSANPFIQQEMTARMMQCQFAVPLVLPSKDPEGPGRFLLWPLRNVVTQWTSDSADEREKGQVQDLASRSMPMVSFLKFGHLSVSKSQVLNCISSQHRSCREMFVHREMEGGHLPRKLANGLVEIGWCVPTGGTVGNRFPAPMAICNLRGDATKHEQCLTFLCQASSAVVVFCGQLHEKEKQILASCNNLAKKLIVVDVSETEKNVKSNLGFAGVSFGRTTGIPKESVVQGKGLNVEEIAKSLSNTLKVLLPTELTHVSMVEAAKTASEIGLEVDEGAACKKALSMVEEVLEGLGEDLGQFKEKQLPLQGFFWKKLGEIERIECKSRIERKPLDPELRREKKYILAEYKRYKITQSMKVFINAMSATDKVERAYFLRWLKLKLKLKQKESQGGQRDLFSFVHTENNVPENPDELQNGFAENLSFSDCSSADSTSEGENLEALLGAYAKHANKQPNSRKKVEQAVDRSTAEDTQSDSLPQKSPFLEKIDEHQNQNEPKLKLDPNCLFNQDCSSPDFSVEPQTLVPLQTLKSNSFSDLTTTQDRIGPDASTKPQKVGSFQTLESDSSTDLTTTQDRLYPNVPSEPLVVGSLYTSKSNSFSDLVMSKDVIGPDVSTEPQKVNSLQTSKSHSVSDLATTQNRLYPDVPSEPLTVGSPQNGMSRSFPALTVNQDSLHQEPQTRGLLQTSESHSSSDLTTTNDCLSPEPQMLSPPHGPPSSNLRATHDCMCPDVSTEVQVPDPLQTSKPVSSSLGLEHFLREMGLIFELTCNNFGTRSQNVLGLPGVAADLLLYGVPLEIMDGNASNVPIHWLGCVFAELNRRLPQQKYKLRVLTNLGVHYARNAEVLSAIFGLKFPDGTRTGRGVYMLLLRLPDSVRQLMRCDFLLFLNVAGFGSTSQYNSTDTRIHDHEMAAVAAGMTDVLMHNVSPLTGPEFESDLTVIANALLCIQQYVPMPSCQLLVHDEDINSMLHALQLKHVCEVLQSETGSIEANNADKQNAKAAPCITCVKGPWSSASPFGPVDTQYSTAVLRLKKNVFGTLEKLALKLPATGLADFFVRLNSLWEVVKEDSFYIGLQNRDAAKAFPDMCTEVAQWQENLLDHIESWFEGAEKNIIDTKEKALDEEDQNDLLSELKEDARDEIKTKARKIKTRMNTYIRKNDVLKEKGDSFRPLVMSYVDHLQEQVTENTIQRLEKANESHCLSVQLNKFRTLLEKEQEAEFDSLMRKSNSTNALLQDEQLEEEFEGMWSKIVSTFGFRPAETEDITLRVRNILIQNLINRGLQKHIRKTEAIFFYYMCGFRINDDYLKYRSRVSNIILRRKDAEKLACTVVEEYNQFVAEKFSLPACYSESYIKEILEIVEKALQRNPLEFRTAFEVDLKVYLCSAACQDFQRLRERFDKDEQLLTYMSVNKRAYMSKFVYQFRKNDQCQRVAEAFISMIIKPTVLHYIYSLMGPHIVEEIRSQHQQYQSSHTFSQSLMEKLITEVRFERFLEFLHFYNGYRQKRIRETVLSHLSESTTLNEWRQDKLCEIVKIITSALNQTTPGTQDVLSDTKPLLEEVCVIIQNDANIDVSSVALNGPLFSITTEWATFVTCLKKLLAEMQADLNQEFSQSVDVTQLLRCLPCSPQKSLFSKVKGCEKCCPLCKAPCQEVEVGHDVHRAFFHRPKYMLPNVPGNDGPEGAAQSKLEQNQDTDDLSVTCGNLLSIYPDWTMYPDQNHQTPCLYWRYCIFNTGLHHKHC